MTTFKEANQVRAALKMKLSNYAWYSASGVFTVDADYLIVITVKKIDNQVRKLIPPVIDGVSIKTELE